MNGLTIHTGIIDNVKDYLVSSKHITAVLVFTVQQAFLLPFDNSLYLLCFFSTILDFKKKWTPLKIILKTVVLEKNI